VTAYERRQSILQLPQKQSGIRVPELAQVLGVSNGTIRNDRQRLRVVTKSEQIIRELHVKKPLSRAAGSAWSVD